MCTNIHLWRGMCSSPLYHSANGMRILHDNKLTRLSWSVNRYFFRYLPAPVRSDFCSLTAICLTICWDEERYWRISRANSRRVTGTKTCESAPSSGSRNPKIAVSRISRSRERTRGRDTINVSSSLPGTSSRIKCSVFKSDYFLGEPPSPLCYSKAHEPPAVASRSS